jgi:REP element-mobilizing transposase RayT
MSDNPILPQRKRHRLPVDSYILTDNAYFFTVCARHQGKPFRNPDLARTVVDSLIWTRNKYQWKLYCYCLMPDHMHFVCRPTVSGGFINAGSRGFLPESTLDHLARFKSFTTSASWKHGFSGPLWQRSSFDVILDETRPFEVVAGYVLENPVRKQLVADWTMWPFSGIVDEW